MRFLGGVLMELVVVCAWFLFCVVGVVMVCSGHASGAILV